MTTNLKRILLKEAGLLSISQSDLDLFFIAQANAVTYKQLAMTALHGATATSGRLSLKRLEKDGYLAAKTMPGNAQEKYYCLTFKGRKRAARLFGEDFFRKMRIDLERRPPSSQQQLPHRIHTGDFYFAFLGNPYLAKLPVWHIEAPYGETRGALPTPRCDGMLETAYGRYYIEQDNCTQGENALNNKISQYMSSGCFLGNNMAAHALIFTLYAEAKERPVKKPPYSVYRILLKAERVWESLELETGEKLSFAAFCARFENSASPSLAHLSGNDRIVLENLASQYPYLTRTEIQSLKKSFLHDASAEDYRRMEQDALFVKRLRQRFYSLPECREQATLRSRLRRGLRFYVMPNHRLHDYLPYALQEEYRFPDFLRQFLFHMGLNDLEAWHYHNQSTVQDNAGTEYTFRNVLCADSGARIIAEDIAHDLGGRERVSHYLKTHAGRDNCLFLLFAGSRDDAAFYMDTLECILHRPDNMETAVCFADKSAALYQNPASCSAYFHKPAKEGAALWLPAAIEYDAFLAELHLIEREVPMP